MGARRSFRFEGGPPLLCVVLDAAAFGDDASARARALFRAGADWLQLRDRGVSDAQLLAVARALVEARDTVEGEVGARADRLRVVVNKRADVARAGGADGAHTAPQIAVGMNTNKCTPYRAQGLRKSHNIHVRTAACLNPVADRPLRDIDQSMT